MTNERFTSLVKKKQGNANNKGASAPIRAWGVKTIFPTGDANNLFKLKVQTRVFIFSSFYRHASTDSQVSRLRNPIGAKKKKKMAPKRFACLKRGNSCLFFPPRGGARQRNCSSVFRKSTTAVSLCRNLRLALRFS